MIMMIMMIYSLLIVTSYRYIPTACPNDYVNVCMYVCMYVCIVICVQGTKADVYGARALVTAVATTLRQALAHGSKLEVIPPVRSSPEEEEEEDGRAAAASAPSRVVATSYEEAVSAAEALSQALAAVHP
jgi:hypothetical protein